MFINFYKVVATLFLLFIASCESSGSFESSGRLLQVEYADRAALSGGTLIAARSHKHAIIISWSNKINKGFKSPSKILTMSTYLGAASVGVFSDCSHLMNKLFDKVIEHTYIFQSEPSSRRVANSIADYVHQYTMIPALRPLGIRMVICGYDDRSAQANLHEIDAMGNIYDSKLSCVGPFAQELMKNWPQSVDPANMSLIELIMQCMDILHECFEKNDIGVSLHDNYEIGLGIVGKDIPFQSFEAGSVTNAILRREPLILEESLKRAGIL